MSMVIKPAHRVREIGELPASAAFAAATEGVPAELLDAVRAALLGGETHYTSRPGLLELRKSISGEIGRLGGPRFDPASCVVITTGEAEGLFTTLLAVRAQVKSLSVGALGPCAHAPLFRMLGFRLRRLSDPPTVPEETELVYREHRLPEAVHRVLLSAVAERQLIDVLNVGSIVGSRATGLPVADEGRTIVVGSLDRLVSRSAFAVGFVAGPDQVMRRVRTWKQAFSICTAAPSQRAAVRAFELRLQEAR